MAAKTLSLCVRENTF